MSELTDNQMKRQDWVDNSIFELARSLNPSANSIEWNIEMIAEIRDTIQDWFVENLQLCSSEDFYPSTTKGGNNGNS